MSKRDLDRFIPDSADEIDETTEERIFGNEANGFLLLSGHRSSGLHCGIQVYFDTPGITETWKRLPPGKTASEFANQN